MLQPIIIKIIIRRMDFFYRYNQIKPSGEELISSYLRFWNIYFMCEIQITVRKMKPRYTLVNTKISGISDVNYSFGDVSRFMTR